MGVAALLLARHFAHQPKGSPRFSGTLVLAGFTLNALYDGTLGATGAASTVLASGWGSLAGWGWMLQVLPALALVPALAALAVLVASAYGTPSGEGGRLGANRLALASLLPVTTAVLQTPMGDLPALISSTGWQFAFVTGLWRLSLPVLATYALVRYQLFNIDIKIKKTMHGGVIATAFFAVFFLVSQSVEALVETRWGPVVGVGAAGTLALVSKRLDRLAARIVHRMMPHTHPLQVLNPVDRAHLFMEQLALAYQDGTVTPKERDMLDRLRLRLGLTERDALRLERGVRRTR